MASNSSNRSSSICQYKIMRPRPPALPWGIKASGRVEAKGEADGEVGGASKNWLLMKTIENSETTWQSKGKGEGRLPAVSGESSSSQLADTPGRRSPAHSHSNWLNWLRLLISIKAFNRQAPQTAGNILFIWGFCLHNRQASKQAAHNFNNPLPPCAPGTRSIARLAQWHVN